MRVTISRTDVGLSVYIHKKDLEEPIISVEHKNLWGGLILLKNGWRIALPDLSQNRRLPFTVDARRLSS
ncbi:putative nitrogen fixation protein NifT [Rhizobium laguerreae]|uniref:putative nitrogen fixation protein NifT n=1 Tax=Rhizobium laguerreae TaxID=1076926 RepID=UPI001C907A18|nr:putative nitrogen fixation protein NifT [Rhizobium laguerreae]MBY3381734.1 putative nitrogen fixation protein NifT [Rhizobium laguerreae]